ncbi:hypothetical protein LAZ67_1005310 [Cordylochernes scorpioides]|uniref:Uncharacterized protein n=1 Tax=Cordylochernes scorpioides TaxID=51811 RepID=A0ABY6K1N6_9ARAC|nr:hypothetical protein LAZ67_1005310 [Cordylochernes scorpioides]
MGKFHANLDHVGVSFVWGLAVFVGLFASIKGSGGHINPAVTIALATLNKFPWRKVPHYLISQYLGAFAASGLLYLLYHDAIVMKVGDVRELTGANGTADIWTTFLQPWVSVETAMFDQILGTAILMFTVLAIVDPNNLKVPEPLVPLYAGLLVTSLVFGFAYNCMAPLNPARDLGPRVFVAIAGWGSEAFSSRNGWIGILGPHLGAILGGWVYYLSLENNRPAGEQPQREASAKISAVTDTINKLDNLFFFLISTQSYQGIKLVVLHHDWVK